MSPGSGDVSSMVMAGMYSRAPKAWHNLSLQRLRPKPHVLPRCPANRHFSPVLLIPGAVSAHGWTVAGIRALFIWDLRTPWPPIPSRRRLLDNPRQRSPPAHAYALLLPIRFHDYDAVHARAFPSQLPPRAGQFPHARHALAINNGGLRRGGMGAERSGHRIDRRS